MGHNKAGSVEVDDFISFFGDADAHGVGQASTTASLDAQPEAGTFRGILGFQ